MTPQQQMQSTLAQAGIPAKEIKCYGAKVMVTCLGEDSARRFAALLHKFCAKVRGPIESVDYDKTNTNTVLVPSSHKVWRVWGSV